MILRRKYSKVDVNTFFLLLYFIYILNQVFSESQYNNINSINMTLKLIRWSLMLFFSLIIIVRGKYSRKSTAIFFSIFTAYAVINMMIFNGKILMVIMGLILIASYKCPIDKLFKTHISAVLSGYIFVICSTALGVIEDVVYTKVIKNLDTFFLPCDSVRHTMGFLVANQIPIAILFIYLYVILVKRDNYKFKNNLLLIIANVIAYYLFSSRAVCIIIFATMFMHYFALKHKVLFIKIGSFLSYVSLIMLTVVSVLGPMFLDLNNALINKLDIMLSFRITIIKRALNLYPLTLGGYGDTFKSNHDLSNFIVLDNGYISLFVQRGIIFGVLIIIAYVMLITIAKKNRDPYVLLVSLMVIIYNGIDSSFILYQTIPLYCLLLNTGRKMFRLEPSLKIQDITG